MRVEVGSPNARNARIWLNGKPMQCVVMADDEKGCVEFYPKENGRFIRNGDEFLRRTEYGDVKIAFEPDK